MSRRSVRASWKVVAVLGAIAAAVVVPSSAAHAGCTRDSECKGARICENGRCVNPQGGQAQGSGSVQPAPAVAPGPGPLPAPAMSAPPAPPQNVPMPPAMPGSAPMQYAPAPGAPVGPAAAPPQPWAGAMPVGAGLTESQLSDLRSAGASLDAKDMEIADRLLRRGFSGDDIVAAYREHNALKNTYPEFGRFGREMVETVAVGRKLSLGENDKYWLVWYRHDENLSLTDAYNRRVVGGPGLKTAGWIMSGIGVPFLVIGGILYDWGMGHRTDSYGDILGHNNENAGWAGLAILIAGGALFATGAPCLILGYYRSAKWVPPDALDSAPADSIPSLRASAREPAIRWAVSPLVGPNQAGLGMRGSF